MINRIKRYIKRGFRYIISGVPINYVTAEVNLLLPSGKLKNKKILITGGSRGLGKAMAAKFVSEGADVLITGRDSSKLASVAEEIGCKYIVGDINDDVFLRSLVKKAVEKLSGLNVLVNNAGISLHEWELDRVTEEGFDRQISTNLRGPFFLSQEFIKYLTTNEIRHASILFVSSERSQQADIIPYGLTKAAMNSFVQGLAKRYTSTGIRVNAVAPGVTASDMTGIDRNSNIYYDANTCKRAYLPEEVAEIASFLISDVSTCLSGQILVCNEAKTVNSYF